MSREAFEKSRQVPGDAVFCEEHDGYVNKDYPTTRHPHDEFWCAFQDGYEAAADAQQARIVDLEQQLKKSEAICVLEYVSGLKRGFEMGGYNYHSALADAIARHQPAALRCITELSQKPKATEVEE